MQIKTITVKKLFGIFDYTIPLNMDDRITIIHAPNGFGKTIILKMLYGLFNGYYRVFRLIPFEEFRVDFDDNTSIWVNKKGKKIFLDISDTIGISDDPQKSNKNHESSQNIIKREIPQITINLSYMDNSETKVLTLSDIYDHITLKEMIEWASTRAELRSINSTEWIYIPTGEIFSLYDILDQFFADKLNLPDWWNEICKSINIQFIETQRLRDFAIEFDSSAIVYRKKYRTIISIETYANDLIVGIEKKLLEFATLSQSLDRTYPSRLLEQMEKQNNFSMPSEQISNELNNLETRRSELRELGILDKDIDVSFSIPEKANVYTKEVLFVYIKDIKEKLKIFDEIASKINLFKEIITKKFLYKEIIFSRESGFHFISSDGTRLPLYALSSGEQHELVMLYQLLFKTKPDSLILIDEPETSLHVAWQVQYLKDLSEITSLAGIDVILATHSPQIINDRWDLTVELKAPNKL
jgi:predicted ATP-binding protein involved in virulence